MWNPVKELKGVVPSRHNWRLGEWNPVKELKGYIYRLKSPKFTAVESGEGIERRWILNGSVPLMVTWNPVKELKVLQIRDVVRARILKVESGEGIESHLFQIKYATNINTSGIR